jgi:signal transduction histidine kinase
MNSCDHLNQIGEVTTAGAGCEECGRSGDSWVHLRVCLTCGHIGCCDESKNRHAHRHYHETGHPIIRSFEPGEDWMWCYVDSTVLYPSPETGGVHVATSKEFLRSLTLFAGLDEEDLDHLTSMAEPVSVKAGEVLIVEGSPGDSMYVVLDGELEVTKQGAQGPVLLSVRRKGEVIGEQSLLEHGPRSATVRAITECRLLKISEAAFGQVLASSPSAVTAVLRTVTSRLRSTQSLLMQQEKMASLGNLAAGLAHELNNPAAAVRRSADHLTDVMTEWQRLAVELDTLTFSPEQATRMRDLREEMSRRCSDEVVLAPLERSDLEGELEVWLDEHGVTEAWDRAPVLVSFGWSVDDLEQLAEDFPPEHLPVVLPWLAVGCSAYGLLDEVKTGAGRISDIVKAVKTYSYLDQAPIQDANLHEGLENTLVILKHKLKAGVTVHREYAPDLPHIEAFASELNQVWTNLIDNAIDAMNGQGDLTIRTYDHRELGEVVVEIEDTGPGIPEEVQPHMFELFFTTKGPGAGTGLGLHIVHNIIVNKHRGRLDFTSRPGQTVFQITLPIQLARRES